MKRTHFDGNGMYAEWVYTFMNINANLSHKQKTESEARMLRVVRERLKSV